MNGDATSSAHRHTRRILASTGRTPVAGRPTWPPLPPVNWKQLGDREPSPLPSPGGKRSPLPEAKVVVLAWTTAEWAALSHVFCGGDRSLPYDFDDDPSWRDGWLPYRLGWSEVAEELPSTAPSLKNEAWGSTRLVELERDTTALLFKSDMHLTTDGRTIPLRRLLDRIVDESRPDLIVTTGTAGGTRLEDCLGAVMIGTSAEFDLKGDQEHHSFNHTKYETDWVPHRERLDELTPALLVPPVTIARLEALARKFAASHDDENHRYSLSDLLNEASRPGAMTPAVRVAKGPVLTSNEDAVADTSGAMAGYACLEMDDAVVAMIASERRRAFSIVRNISDPVQNAGLRGDVQSDWAYELYTSYGLYSSYNSALVASRIARTP